MMLLGYWGESIGLLMLKGGLEASLLRMFVMQDVGAVEVRSHGSLVLRHRLFPQVTSNVPGSLSPVSYRSPCI